MGDQGLEKQNNLEIAHRRVVGIHQDHVDGDGLFPGGFIDHVVDKVLNERQAQAAR